MKERYIIGLTALCMAVIGGLQGWWIHHTWTHTIEKLQEQATEVLEEAAHLHSRELFLKAPRGSRIDEKEGSGVSELTIFFASLEKMGYSARPARLDSIADRLLQKRDIPAPHSVRPTGGGAAVPHGAIVSDTLFTRTDRSQGVILCLERPHKAIFDRLYIILLTTVSVTLLALLGFARLMKRTLAERELHRMREEFSYAMAHGMKAPLRSLKMCAEVLEWEQTTPHPEKRKEYIGRLHHSIDALQEKVYQILTSYAMVHEHVSIRAVPVSLPPLLDELMQQTISATRKEVRFVTDRQTDTVCAQENLLASVLGNLLGNSVKYSGDSVEIRITATSEGGFDILRIRDNGYGIARKDFRRIFRKFKRSPSSVRSPKDSPVGFGLGLYFVKQVMDAHGGRVTVDSVVGEWTEFALYFPKWP